MINKTKNGVPLYDPGETTRKEVLAKRLDGALEDSDYYYAHEQSDDPYAEAWWVIDKKTGDLSWTYILDLFLTGVYDKAKSINPETLRRAFA